jgi:hypothetical protein
LHARTFLRARGSNEADEEEDAEKQDGHGNPEMAVGQNGSQHWILQDDSQQGKSIAAPFCRCARAKGWARKSKAFTTEDAEDHRGDLWSVDELFAALYSRFGHLISVCFPRLKALI